MEFHALAQMKAPARRLRRFPALGKPRNDLQILVTRDQSFINMTEMGVGRRLIQRVGIERLELALVGVAQGLRRDRCGERGE